MNRALKIRSNLLASDMRRLQSYAHNLVDHHLVMDLVPMLASLRFTERLRTPLSHVQAAILLVPPGISALTRDDESVQPFPVPTQLLQADQLGREKRAGRCFQGFDEAPITFAPTYKCE